MNENKKNTRKLNGGNVFGINCFFTYLCSIIFTKKKQMVTVLLALVLGLFAAMLFLNVYFRVKVFKLYKILVQNRVEFGAAHLFNKQKMEEEVISRYPHMREHILAFVNHIQYSMRMATVLIFLITLFGAILMYFK